MTGLAQRGHDDGRRHPRDGLRPPRRQPGRLHGRRPDRRGRRRPTSSSPARAATGPRTSSPRSSPTDRRSPTTCASPRIAASSRRRHALRCRPGRLRQGGHARTVDRRAAAPARPTATPAPPPAPRDAGHRRRDHGQPDVRHDEAARQGRSSASRTTSPASATRTPRPASTRGFDIEIAKLIAAKLGFDADKIEFKAIASANRETAIEQRRDRLLRRHLLDQRQAQGADRAFAGPYFMAGQGLLVAQGRHDDHRPGRPQGQEGLLGRPAPRRSSGSRTRSSPRRNIVEFETYSQCVDAAARRPGRRGHHRRRDPARATPRRSPTSSRSSASRSPTEPLRHRPAARTTRRCATTINDVSRPRRATAPGSRSTTPRSASPARPAAPAAARALLIHR